MNSPSTQLAEPEEIIRPINAYDRLAAEYDDAEHRTTRILESLSRKGLSRAFRRQPVRVGRILELGAGTGALTGALLETWPGAEVLATDPSADMVAVLTNKLSDGPGRLSTAVAGITQAGTIGQGFDLVTAGLADPFLDEAGLLALRPNLSAGTHLFLSVPSRRWARRERIERLGTPLDVTRFRLRDGTEAFARSLTYDTEDLRQLVLATGFVPIGFGAESSEQIWSQPEVCWALARAGE
jgi:SAM-dependent methyltransferase